MMAAAVVAVVGAWVWVAGLLRLRLLQLSLEGAGLYGRGQVGGLSSCVERLLK